MSNRHTTIAFANEVAQFLHQRFRILDVSLLDPGYCMLWFLVWMFRCYRAAFVIT
jgi:hypothetical protein